MNHNRKAIILKAGHAIMAMNVQRFIEDAIEEIRRDVLGRAIIGLSGGVDSSACAMTMSVCVHEDLDLITSETSKPHLRRQAQGTRLFRIPRLLPSWTAGPLGFATETTASRVTSRRTSPVREGLPVGQDQQLSKIRFEGGRPPQVL